MWFRLFADAPADGTERRKLCRAHLRGLRQIPCFRSSRIVVVPETNLDVVQDIAEDLLNSEAGVSVLCARRGRYGVLTLESNKGMYVDAVNKRLAENAICYHSHVVSANPFTAANTPAIERVAKARKEFERQLRSFRRIMVLPKALLSAIRIAHSGRADKDNKRSGRMRDDMTLALALGIHWSGHHAHCTGNVHEYGHGNRLIRPHVPGDEMLQPPDDAIGAPMAGIGALPAAGPVMRAVS